MADAEQLKHILRDESLWSPRAFGNPDGHRASLSDFIEFPTNASSADRTRILVGRKGSGKTVYLRRLKAEVDDSPSVESLGPSLDVPASKRAPVSDMVEQSQLLMTRHVLRVGHWYPPAVLTEIWMQLWGRAIIRSVLTYCLFDRRLTVHIDGGTRAALRRHYADQLGSADRVARTPFTCVKEFITSAASGTHLANALDDPRWDDLENELADILYDLPPIYLYIDAVDEEFAHAPMYWLRCQKGLFYQTMRLLRHGKLGGRLHVLVCIRDLVLSSVYLSEHGTRYMNDPYVRRLSWNGSSAARFLREKIARLDQAYTFPERAPVDLGSWIGLHEVTNSLGSVEPVETYVLRHTQMLPREIVLLGNLLGRAVEAARAEGKASLTESILREVVSAVALIAGTAQLAVAANQIISDEIPEIASNADFTEVYTSVREYVETRASQLVSFLKAEAGYLEITETYVRRLEHRSKLVFGETDICTVLWQNGLMGYVDESGGRVFYTFDLSARFSLPRGRPAYVFHPSLRECAGLLPGRRPADAQ